MKQEFLTNAVLCSKCFLNQGLKLDAERIGVEQEGACLHCGAADGKKLDKDLVETLAFRFFVRGTYHRATYGGAPVVQMNEQHYRKTDLGVPESLKRNIALLEEAGGIGFFYYGPREWMVGEVEPLKALQDERQRAGVVQRILDAYPRLRFGREEVFYRLREAPKDAAAGDEYDSPPDSFLGTYRFNSPSLPILYASQDLERHLHQTFQGSRDTRKSADYSEPRALWSTGESRQHRCGMRQSVGPDSNHVRRRFWPCRVLGAGGDGPRVELPI